MNEKSNIQSLAELYDHIEREAQKRVDKILKEREMVLEKPPAKSE